MRYRSERGATLVEAAIVTPLVVFLFLGIIWACLTGRDYLTVDEAARVGAREGSIAASSRSADYDILQAIGKAVSAGDQNSVKSIVVYRADGFEQAPPEACTVPGAASSTSLGCNVYDKTDLSRPKEDFLSSTWVGDEGYSTINRVSSRSAANEKFLGVYVAFNSSAGHLNLPTIEFSKFRVLRIEATSF